MTDSSIVGGTAETDPASAKPEPGAADPAEKPAAESDPAAPPPKDETPAEPKEPDAKTEEGKAEGEKDEKKEGDKKEGAPEAYEDFTAPEGVELDKEQLEAFVPVAKELNLSQEQAQRLVDLQTEFAAKQAEAQQAQWSEIIDGWANETKSDPEIGGDKLDENLGHVARAMKEFGNDKLREIFDTTGTGNHPEIVRLMTKVGKALAEDRMVLGQAGASVPKSASDLLFPSMAKSG